MSDERINASGKVKGLAEWYASGSSFEKPRERFYGLEERDKVSQQYNRSYLPKSAPKVEEEELIYPLRVRMPLPSDVILEETSGDEVQEEMSTASSTGELTEFEVAELPADNLSFQTLPTEKCESDECEETQSEVETVDPQALDDTKIPALQNKLLQETTARNGTQDAIKKLQEGLERKDQEIQELREKFKRLDLSQEIADLEIGTLRATIESLKGEMAAMEREKQELRESVKKRDERIRELEKEIGEARREKEAEAKKRRQAESAHREELHRQRLAQMDEMNEVVQAVKRQCLQDERESELPTSRTEFYRQRRPGFGHEDDMDDESRLEAMAERQREQLLQRRRLDIEAQNSRMEAQWMQEQQPQRLYHLHAIPQQTRLKQLTNGFDEDMMQPRSSSSRTHRRSRSDNEGGKNMKLSRPKRDRTQISMKAILMKTLT